MKIIKDKKIIEDNWTHIADDDKIPKGNITVSLSRWKKEKIKLLARKENTGIRLSPSDKVEDIADDLEQISLVALEFPAFTDGRSFSHAKLLRSRYGFNSEIRAIGNYMPDQVFYLVRVGVNAFQLESPELLDTALSTMNDFTVQYQASSN
ncbi:MAG: DUF934 domain-containing protein [Methylococcaceae bacterium]|nr:DUF934 domain-containing protein [Methylococcaceae bacterium]